MYSSPLTQSPLGWTDGHVRVNSLTPAILLMTPGRARSAAGSTPSEHVPVAIDLPWQAWQPVAGRAPEHVSLGFAARLQPGRPDQWATSDRRTQGSRCSETPVPSFFRPHPVAWTVGARVFASTARLRTDAEVVASLTRNLVPGTRRVEIDVVRDPEDGESSLHLTVRTSASPDDVVAAEDQLHDALFNRLKPASRVLFSIAYEFVTERHGSAGLSGRSEQTLFVERRSGAQDFGREILLRALQSRAPQDRASATITNE